MNTKASLMMLTNILSAKSKYLLIFLLIPTHVFAETFIYSCNVKLEKGMGIYEDTSLFNMDLFEEYYEYDTLKDSLIEMRTNKKYTCTKNNWVTTCHNKITEKKRHLINFIEIGRKDLSYRMYRVTRRKDNNKNTGDSFQIKGKCKIVEDL